MRIANEAIALDDVTNTIRGMVQRRNLTWREATEVAANRLGEDEAGTILDALTGRPLAIHDSMLAEVLAQKLGRHLEWMHLQLALDRETQWQRGRGDDS